MGLVIYTTLLIAIFVTILNHETHQIATTSRTIIDTYEYNLTLESLSMHHTRKKLFDHRILMT